MSSFALVKWTEENKWSVIQRSKICDEENQNLPDEVLCSKTVDFLWKNKPYSALIQNIGTKAEMKLQMVELEKPKKRALKSEETHKVASKKIKQIQDVVSSIQVEIAQDEETNLLNDEIVVQQSGNSSQEWERKYFEQKNKVKKFRNKIKTLKAKLALFENTEDFQIAPGVFINRVELDSIKTVSLTPTIFARNLMRKVFSFEELAGKSFFGKKSNANKDKPVRPEIDPAKRDAIIAHALMEYGSTSLGNGNRKPKDPLRIQLHRSISDYIREATTKFNEDNLRVQQQV